MKQCKKCLLHLNLDLFKSNRSFFCLYCHNKSKKEIKKKYKDKNIGSARYHIQEKISYWKSKCSIESDLTVDYLVELFHSQNERCYYSGEPIFFGARNCALPNSASLDRKDPKLGYVKGNVVWSSFFINTMKGNLTENEFYEKMIVILKNKKMF